MPRKYHYTRKTGRPSKYSPALGEEICRRLASGQSLREICRDRRMPSDPTTIRMWAITNTFPKFSLQYAQAREAQADHYFDEMFEIADDGSNDWMERQHRNGDIELKPDHEYISRSQLRVDTRKWALARMAPKKYGALVAGEAPGSVNVSVSVSMIDTLKLVAQHHPATRMDVTSQPASHGNGHPHA